MQDPIVMAIKIQFADEIKLMFTKRITKSSAAAIELVIYYPYNLVKGLIYCTRPWLRSSVGQRKVIIQ